MLPLGFKGNGDNDFHEFKPILSEIEERPQNPLGNFIFWVIVTFIILAGLWMYFGKVDVVVTARGIVIPDGEEKLVQSLDKGVLTSLKVQEGEYVQPGQVVAIVQPAEYEPGLELNNLRQEEISIEAELASAKSRLSIVRADLNRLKTVLDIIPQSRYDEVLKESVALRFEINKLQATLAEIQNKRAQIEKQKQILKAPVEGYIGQVFVHTEGAVLVPAEKIVSVVPKGAKLKVKASVLNRDIGFVKPKMPVSIKVDTYDFQKYGMLKGNVDVVSPNSVKKDGSGSEKSGDGRQTGEYLGEIYEVYINLENSVLLVEGKEEAIKTGMTVTSEINIGKRRIIEFFIYPLIKYLDESIKVR